MNSSDQNLSSSELGFWTTSNILYHFLLLFITLINFFTSVIFIIAYLKCNSLRGNKFTFFIFHMTISDLLTIVALYLNLFFFDLNLLQSWFICSFVMYLFYLCFDVSYYFTLLLAVERFVSVVYPTIYISVIEIAVMYTTVIFVWIFSSLTLFIMFFVFSSWNNICLTYELLSKQSFIFYMIENGVTSVAACVLYCTMIYKICIRRKNSSVLILRKSNNCGIGDNKNFNTAIFICTLAFVIEFCRIPYLITSYLGYDKSSHSFTAYKVSIALVLLRPFFSFIVYCTKFKEIRYYLKLAFTIGLWKQQYSSASRTTVTPANIQTTSF